MSDPRHARAKELFLAAAALDAERREELLRSSCGEDLALRAEVESLLRLHDDAGSTGGARLQGLEEALGVGGGRSGVAAPPEIAGYRLEELLGEGGMGAVYRAEQEGSVHREVAVKVLKRGLDTARIVRRFEAERQVISQMSHPNIARLFDAGQTREGRPFFAMELVSGSPITRFCDAQKMDVEERLRLFVVVCHAVQHAHQRGVIHRDLKPSNVLVEAIDGRPVVKLIDFGIAKAVREESSEETQQTALGELLGTPEYMSPEQAEGAVQDLDTRTDVYSLGVLLCELLTGVLPREPRPPRGLAANGQGQRHPAGSTPRRPTPRPSARLRSQGESATALAAFRGSDPGALARKLERDLDWIVLKALEEERERRYASVSELAADVERYLRRLPVLAGPPTVRYRVGRFVARHKLAALAASLLAASLLLGLAGTSIGLVRARQANRAARQQARTAQAVSRFMVDLFQGSDPFKASGDEPSLREILKRGAERARTELSGEPVVQAALLSAIGGVYRNLGLYDEARPLLEQAVSLLRGVSDPPAEQLGSALRAWGSFQGWSGHLDEAIPMLQEARTLFESAGADQELAATDQELGVLLRNSGDYGGARTALERALALRRELLPDGDPGIAETLYHIGWLDNLVGRYQDAERRDLEALAIFEKALGPDSPRVGWCLNDLGVVLWQQGRLDEASEHLERALAIQEQRLGPEHPDLAGPLQNYGNLQGQLGRDEQAEAALRRSLAIREAAAPGSLDVASSLESLGFQLRATGRYDEAQEDYDRAIDIVRGIRGEHSADYARLINNFALLLGDRGQFERALALSAQALAVQEETLGADHPALADTLSNLAVLELRLVHPAAAAGYLERALTIRTAAPSDAGSSIPWTLCGLGEVRSLLHDDQGARDAFRRAFNQLDRIESTAGADQEEAVEVELKCSLQRSLVALRRGDRETSSHWNEHALALIERRPAMDSSWVAQELAARWALLGEKGKAMQELRRAVKLGYRGRLLLYDDFSSLRTLPEFVALAHSIAPASLGVSK